MHEQQAQHSQTLYTIANAAFCVIVVISNIISAKLITFPFFQNLSIPAGLITYPLTFLISDLVTEIYGARKAKVMVYTALGTTILSYVIIQFALKLPSISPENQSIFQSVLGLNGLIISASLIAYIISQILDIQLYSLIKKWTGSRFLWLRNNGSTLISQMVDTAAVNLIHLYWGLEMELEAVFKIMLFSYTYKSFFSVMNTPLFYLGVFLANSPSMNLGFGFFRHLGCVKASWLKDRQWVNIEKYGPIADLSTTRLSR